MTVSPRSPSKCQSRAARFAPLISVWLVFWLVNVSQACCHGFFAAPQAGKAIIGYVHAEDGHPMGGHHNRSANDETSSCPQLTAPDAGLVTLSAELPAATSVPPAPCYSTYPALTIPAAAPGMRGQPPPGLPVYLQTTRLRV